MHKIRGASLLAAIFALTALATEAGELVYQPVNPAFGGNPINGSYLLSNAQAQNDFTGPSSSSRLAQRSALDRFTDSLESRLLNQLISNVGQGNEGTLVTQDFIVDIIDQDGVLTVRVTDLETNETTEIEVSGLNP
jgi:curli production assembly/transport component CsgF